MTRTRCLAEYTDGNANVAFRIGREGDDMVAEWVGRARLVARRDGTLVSLSIREGLDPSMAEKIERGGAALLLRQLEGKMAFHGACVTFGGPAVLLLGRSGQGKSTFAAALCARRGATLLADDAVGIDASGDAYTIIPSERDHWLDGPSRRAVGYPVDIEAKAPQRCARVGDAGVVLGLIVDLAFVDDAADSSAPRLTALSGVDALATIVPQLVRFVVDEPDVLRSELESLLQLTRTVPVVRLERPRGLDRLDASLDVIAKHPLPRARQ